MTQLSAGERRRWGRGRVPVARRPGVQCLGRLDRAGDRQRAPRWTASTSTTSGSPQCRLGLDPTRAPGSRSSGASIRRVSDPAFWARRAVRSAGFGMEGFQRARSRPSCARCGTRVTRRARRHLAVGRGAGRHAQPSESNAQDVARLGARRVFSIALSPCATRRPCRPSSASSGPSVVQPRHREGRAGHRDLQHSAGDRRGQDQGRASWGYRRLRSTIYDSLFDARTLLGTRSKASSAAPAQGSERI